MSVLIYPEVHLLLPYNRTSIRPSHSRAPSFTNWLAPFCSSARTYQRSSLTYIMKLYVLLAQLPPERCGDLCYRSHRVKALVKLGQRSLYNQRWPAHMAEPIHRSCHQPVEPVLLPLPPSPNRLVPQTMRHVSWTWRQTSRHGGGNMSRRKKSITMLNLFMVRGAWIRVDCGRVYRLDWERRWMRHWMSIIGDEACLRKDWLWEAVLML